jgi:hypothetical protein
LASALMLGFSVQFLADEVLHKNTTPDRYARVIFIMTAFGILAYNLFAYSCFCNVSLYF